MKFFADTASLSEIEYCFENHVNDGITTNPKILETTGDLSLGFEYACKSLLKKYPSVPVSLETDLRGLKVSELEKYPEKVRDILLEQAYKLASWQHNVVIKIPVCSGGLLATKELSEKGIKTNVTACMTPYQALEASKLGFGYVSLFANRMLDSHILELAGYNLGETLKKLNWKDIVKENKDKYFEQAWELTLNEIAYVAEELDKNPNVDLIVGSIRDVSDIHRIVQAEPQIITIPTTIVKSLEDILNLKQVKRKIKPENIAIGNSISHPMTSCALEEFEKSADLYRKPQTT